MLKHPFAVERHQEKAPGPAPNLESEVNVTGPIQSPYVGDLVLGALDGSVTTFAVVAAATGAGQPASIVLIIGMANLFASGVSMALGNYLGTKSEEEFREKHRRREEYETERFPELEKEEVRKIFADKGFQGEDLERAVEIITSNKQIWVETMMRDELRISPEKKESMAQRTRHAYRVHFGRLGSPHTLSDLVIRAELPTLGPFLFRRHDLCRDIRSRNGPLACYGPEMVDRGNGNGGLWAATRPDSLLKRVFPRNTP